MLKRFCLGSPLTDRGATDDTCFNTVPILRAAQSDTFECSRVSPERGLVERPARTLARYSYVSIRAA